MNELHSAIDKIYHELFRLPDEAVTQRAIVRLTGLFDFEVSDALDVMFDFELVSMRDEKDKIAECYYVPTWRYMDQIAIEQERADSFENGFRFLKWKVNGD